MTRLPDWPGRLIATVEAAREKPFAWGGHDCCTFAADCIEAMTGVDLGTDLRGTYGSAREARAVLGRAGLVGLATRYLGEPLPTPALAGRGGVALVAVGRRRLLGVVLDHRIAAVGRRGLVFVPLASAMRAWRV